MPTVVTAHGPVTGEFGSYYRDLAQEVALVAISDAQRRYVPHIRWAATVHNAIKAADFRFRETKDDYVLFLAGSTRKRERTWPSTPPGGGRADPAGGKLQDPQEQDYFEAEIKPRLGPDAEFVGEVDMRPSKSYGRRTLPAVSDLLGGAVRHGHDRSHGLRYPGRRIEPRFGARDRRRWRDRVRPG